MANMRTAKTTSGAMAVQIVHSSRRGSKDIEHLGSAHDEEGLAALKAAARHRLALGQAELDLGLCAVQAAAAGGPLQITSSRMGYLWDALVSAYETLGFDAATGGDTVFRVTLTVTTADLAIPHARARQRNSADVKGPVTSRLAPDHQVMRRCAYGAGLTASTLPS